MTQQKRRMHELLCLQQCKIRGTIRFASVFKCLSSCRGDQIPTTAKNNIYGTQARKCLSRGTLARKMYAT